ncbi:CFA61-like protein, partial [Mya arenaria]
MATTIAPEGVPPEAVNARRTESIDAPHILSLVQDSTNSLFGRVNIVNVIEKAVLAVTLCNDKDEILGHAAFFDYPNVADVDQAAWQEWLKTYYDTEKCTPLNTLFMHYFVVKNDYAHGCAREIVRTAFNAVPDVHFLFLAVPVGSYPDSYIADIFKPMTIIGDKSPSQCAVFACYRHDHVPVIHVRQARVEDHDDLTPIFNRQSDMLNMTYGDYFLAELIEAQDDHMHCLIAEVGGTAYGFMSISDDINYNLLNECFELGPFHGLKKPKEDKAPSRGSVKSGSSSTGKPTENTETDLSKVAESITAESGERTEGSRHSSTRSSRAGSAVSDVKVEDQGVSLKPPGTQNQRFIPTYKGAGNAFSVQLFCIDERYEMRSSDFLAKAFEHFSDCDFCIMTVPHLVPEFPLLQNFVRVTPRCPSTLPQELYVFHRNGLFKDFAVRPAASKDCGGVEKLTKTIALHENLLKDLTQYVKAKRDDDGTEIQAFVAESQQQVIGVAIIRIEENIEYIRSHYNIEDFIYYNHHRRADHGRLHHFAINPMFAHLSKHFLKEVLRIGHKTCLYYPLYPQYTDKEVVVNFSLVGCMREMVPVRHRRQIVYPLEQLGVNAPSNRVLTEHPPFALHHINRKLTLEPKVTINARIVVVGASDVVDAKHQYILIQKSCSIRSKIEQSAWLMLFAPDLSQLLIGVCSPHLHFNNLTLVSPHGITPGEMAPDDMRENMLGSSHCYSHADYARIALQASVNIVYGNMTAIDRKKKFVQIDGSTRVPYDHLVLCTGEQYQVPMPTNADVNAGTTNDKLPCDPNRRFTGERPRNLFTVNDAYEAAVALYWIENNLAKKDRKVVVYGGSLDAYTCVQTLLAMGVAGSNIIFVQTPLQYEVTCFNNPTIEETMLKTLQESGVQLHSGYILAKYVTGDAGEIRGATFTSADSPLKVDCCVTINDACLVYDGKLVIDAYFHTNDVCIRGAGSLTKFQRKYHAEKWSHANFNSKEVGIH